MATLTIFAGINGAGKTTLYSKLNESGEIDCDYICPDDILSLNNWDWKNVSHKFASGKIAINLINDYLENKQSFCWETTIFGSFALNTITKAKEQGFFVNLHFIYVDDLQRSLDRIQKRVQEGGHGISEVLVENKFKNQTRSLAQILTMTDTAYIYDNKKNFKIKGVLFDKQLKFFDFNNDFSKTLTEEYEALVNSEISEL